VVDRSFQTTSASWARVAAFAVTTRVRTIGPASVAAGIVPMFQVIELGATLADSELLSGVASRNDADGGAAMETETLVASLVMALVTKTRNGKASPGFTQPTELTKLARRASRSGESSRVRAVVPASPAAHVPVVGSV
jgi:hypothetical protein